jgi:uncharacterized integral membrane protein (TIGR00698 family)
MLTEIRRAKAGYRGLVLALTVAACAKFVSEHYGAPVMMFALLIGMAFNFMSADERCAPGIEFASKTLLRIGVALLGFRLSLSEIANLGVKPVLAVVSLVVLTIVVGIAIAPFLGRRWRFGLLTGGSVAICGASAALAISAVLPKGRDLERDTLFTVVAVTTFSTVAMVVYPILFALLGLDDAQTGFLIGATIHDVAQVVGAGFSVSDTAGNLATLVKIQRVVLLPVLLLAIVLTTGGDDKSGIRLPGFIIAFVALVLLNSFGVVPDLARALVATASQWLLIIAIAALGVKTSLKAMLELGAGHLAVIVGETLFLLIAAVVAIDLLS